MRAFFSATLVVLLAGCQDYYFGYRPSERVSATTVREVVVQNTDTDILFIVDNSGSMREEQENLVRNTEAFVQVLATSENLYRVGIITTDLFDGNDGGRLRLTGGAPPYLVRPDLSLDPVQLEAQRQALIDRFRNTVDSLGTSGDGREAGLEAARRALDPDSEAAAHNDGFLRQEADLALIFLTDEDDCSFSSYEGGIWTDWNNGTCYDYRNQGVAPSWYVDFFAGLKNDDVRKIRAALIAGGTFSGEGVGTFQPSGCNLTASGPSSNCGCWSSSDDSYFCQLLQDYRHPCEDTTGCSGTTCASISGDTCDTDRCEALPSTEYHDFMVELGNRRRGVGFPRGTHEDSICQAEYDQTLRGIANTVVLTSCFSLEAPPLDADSVYLSVTHTDPESGEVTELDLLQCTDLDGNHECLDCGSFPDGAWRFADDSLQTICLDCGLKKETGDDFLLTVLNEDIEEEEM